MMMTPRQFEINWKITFDTNYPASSDRVHENLNRSDLFKNRADLQTTGIGSKYRVLTVLFNSNIRAQEFMEKLEKKNIRLCGRGLLLDLDRDNRVCFLFFFSF